MKIIIKGKEERGERQKGIGSVKRKGEKRSEKGREREYIKKKEKT